MTQCSYVIPGSVARGSGGLAGITPYRRCSRRATHIDIGLRHQPAYCSTHARIHALEPKPI